VPATSPRHAEIIDSLVNRSGPYYDWEQKRFPGFRLLEWSYGLVRFEWAVGDDWLNPDDTMFGGHVASSADHVASVTAMSALTDEAERFRTSRLSVDMFRPVTRPRVEIEGRALNVSKQLIHIEADYRTPEGKLAARMTALQVLRIRPITETGGAR